MKDLKPEQARVFDARDFAGLVMLGIAAGESPEGDPVVVDAPRADGTVEVLQVPDNPYSKATFALRRHFPDDDLAFASALMRFRALMNLLSRGGLEGWVRRSGDGRLAIHPAALDVASQFKVSNNGRFPPRKFQQAMAEVAQAHYKSLAGWTDGEDGCP